MAGTYDLVIVGGGISGASLVYTTSKFTDIESIALVEKEEEIAAIQKQLEDDAARIASDHDPASLLLETETLKPTRTNVKVDEVCLLWLPFDSRGERAW